MHNMQQAIASALAAKEAWAVLSPGNKKSKKFRDLENVLLKWKYELCCYFYC